MEQSDQLLINSLRDFVQIPSKIQTLSDIKDEEIFNIAISILENMGFDVKDIRQISKQKFRSMTKLNQKIYKELQIQLQLNDLLNPTPTFVRKTLLIFLSKLSSGQNQNTNLTKQGQINFQKRKRKTALANWLQDEWIHPALQRQSKPLYEAYLFPILINKKSIKGNILEQLQKSTIKNNILPILTTSLNRNIMKQKQSQLNTGITKKKYQDSSNIQTGKLISSNFQDWNMAQQKLNKIKRKIQKDKQNLEAQKVAQQEAKIAQIKQENEKKQTIQSVFQIEVTQKIEDNQKQKQSEKQSVISTNQSQDPVILMTDNPLQKLKKQSEYKKIQYQKLIHQLLIDLSNKKQQIDSIESNKQQIQAKIIVDQQKLIEYKNRTDQLKKEVQKKQLVLTAAESPKQIEQQIKKFEEDIKEMEEQVKEQVSNTNQTIESLKVQSEKKLQALKDLKIKLHRIQNDYKEVCEDIDEKNQRKGKIKINKSGISRTYYSKKISETEKRWRDTQKETTKIKKDLQLMKQKTKIVTDISGTLQRQITGYIDADKSSKTQVETKALRQVFLKCQNCFKTTLETLQKINEVKQQTREYEVKVHALTSQNYKQGIQKVSLALGELKKQIQQISKSRQGK